MVSLFLLDVSTLPENRLSNEAVDKTLFVFSEFLLSAEKRHHSGITLVNLVHSLDMLSLLGFITSLFLLFWITFLSFSFGLDPQGTTIFSSPLPTSRKVS